MFNAKPRGIAIPLGVCNIMGMIEFFHWLAAHWRDLLVHFGLEVVGQGVLWLAYTHVCRKQWHRVAIWFLGTLLTTILTVNIIG